MKIAIVTNIPTPYRNPVYSKLSQFDKVNLFVFYCSLTEPNRSWKLQNLSFKHKFLSNKKDRFVHFNWNILKELNQFNPDVVITSGFNPTILLAWLWSLIKKKKHVPFSDANIHSQSNLSVFHKLIRKLVYKTSAAFIGSSDKTLDLFKSYHIDKTKLFKSCLAIDNESFRPAKNIQKKYDLLFCGQFNERKNPLFFVELSKNINELKPGIRVLLIGNGPLKEKTLEKLKDYQVIYDDAGFVQPSEIINYYHMSKLFIFPTQKDSWGLVANEALAAGVPVLVSSVAGVASELVIDGYNGYVFENFELKSWVEKTYQLLTNQNLYENMSKNSIQSIDKYSHEKAAVGIFQAASFAFSEK
jgi:glycosyltransferase involved in cell wall biosynthesis